MHHPRVDTEHLYVKRENGGGGLIQQEMTYKTITIGLKKYLDITTDWILQLINTHKKRKKNIQLIYNPKSALFI